MLGENIFKFKFILFHNFLVILFLSLEREVLTQTMVDIIEQDAADDADRNTLLFRKLTHRGPKAFQNILQILKDKHYDEAHKLLSVSIIPSATFSNEDVDFEENTLSIGNTKNIIRSTSTTTTSSNYNNNNNSINIEDSPAQEPVTSIDGLFSSKPKTLKLKPYTKKTSFHFDSDVEVKRAANYGSHPKLQVYPMKSKKRGVFFFVNIINFTSDKAKREGAERDKENLVTLFSEMNYTVFYYEDLKRHEFFDLLGQLLKSDFIKCIDSFVFCIQTHGDMYQNQTIMEFSDGLSERIERIISLFSNKECEDLALKPKVFFFPFCRGKIADKEKKIAFSRIESDGNANMVPSFSDILICYGTVPGKL